MRCWWRVEYAERVLAWIWVVGFTVSRDKKGGSRVAGNEDRELYLGKIKRLCG